MKTAENSAWNKNRHWLNLSCRQLSSSSSKLGQPDPQTGAKSCLTCQVKRVVVRSLHYGGCGPPRGSPEEAGDDVVQVYMLLALPSQFRNSFSPYKVEWFWLFLYLSPFIKKKKTTGIKTDRKDVLRNISQIFGGFMSNLGLPWWLSGKESTCNARDPGSIPGSERFPWSRK